MSDVGEPNSVTSQLLRLAHGAEQVTLCEDLVSRQLFNRDGMLVTADGKPIDYIISAFDVRRFIYPPYVLPPSPSPPTQPAPPPT